MSGSAGGRRDASTRKADPDTKRVRSAEDFDIIIGFLGFWALVLLVTTIVMEVTGQPAVGWALGLLAIVLALWGMLRLRKKLPRRTSRRLS
ncbi:hypothetical protein SAMN04487917_10627 [Arthrobacter sp. yr096]|uniref:hypothetical protein n=1 Tax=unclassified Arthrobacter TaxID=235627 RepID=UPI00089B9FDA|nr:MULTISPECIES: hypothetical protein [unclassified Arthrobacter]SDX46601.1 hypothetical protein SAMN04487912_11336 [Arthrobacter sp. cf158]SEJ46059.1 hypothetical protein SAMN04487917_10627 [Arthrobacter sp. yr096]